MMGVLHPHQALLAVFLCQSAKAFVGSSSCTPGLQFSRETRQLPARSVLQAHERRMCPRGRGARGLAVQQGDTNADTADGDSDALFASLRARQKQLEQERSRRKLVDFSVEAVVNSWRGVNDVVMGGRSTGYITYERFLDFPEFAQSVGPRDQGGFGVFQGVVTSEGGGGFSSIRSGMMAEVNCSAAAGLSIWGRGDGRVYKLQVTCDRLIPGVKYQVEFETPRDEWVQLRFKWNDFRASVRGQMVLGAPAFTGQGITSLGLLTSKLTSSGGSNAKFQSGPFRLEIASISEF